MPDVGILTPGISDHDPDDEAIVRALVRTEVAWTDALARHGLVSTAARDEIRQTGERIGANDAGALSSDVARQAGASGNPVIPLVEALRAAIPADHHDAVHTGLTSQDALDTALTLVVRDAAVATDASLASAQNDLADLARTYRDHPVLAHTLGQAALPTTMGLRAATWLQAVGEARERLRAERDRLPVAFGGPVGTLSVPTALPDDAALLDVVATWAESMDLAMPAAPWHVTRFPVLRVASALAEVCAAAGKLASDVLAAGRPEVGEMRERPEEGRGGSSSMPFKSNPVHAITIKRSALVAPGLLSQVFLAAAVAADERPDGAWHAEWEALRGLARHALIAAESLAALVAGLEVDTARMASNRDSHGPTSSLPDHSAALVDRVLERYGDTP